jgi:hypothetical protein
MEDAIRCAECDREVDEFTALAENWEFWSDGRDLVPYCPECSRREFQAPATEPLPQAHPRALGNGG